MSQAGVLVERHDRVVVLQLNRPDQLNALSPDLMDELLSALRAADGDPTVGAVVIAGHERAFVAGADCWREAALELAATVAAGPPLAVRLAKRAVLAAEDGPMAVGMLAERKLMELAFASDDRVEGMTAFIERRATALVRTMTVSTGKGQDQR